MAGTFGPHICHLGGLVPSFCDPGGPLRHFVFGALERRLGTMGAAGRTCGGLKPDFENLGKTFGPHFDSCFVPEL